MRSFPFLLFLSIVWYCGAGGFGLIWSKSLSHSLAEIVSLVGLSIIDRVKNED